MPMRCLEHVVSPWNTIDVIEQHDGRIDFDVTGATHATWHPHLLLTGHAWDALTAAALCHPGNPGRMLLLGLGGGTVLRQLRHFLPECQVTAIEIDPDMIRLARAYMEVDTLGIEVIQDDAFDFLDRDSARYDIIIDDLYRCGTHDVERPRPVTRDSLAGQLSRLNPGGLLVANFVLGQQHDTVHHQARKAFRHHFGAVRALRPPLSHNEVLVGTPAADGLRSARHLKALATAFPDPRDQKFWKALRNQRI